MLACIPWTNDLRSERQLFIHGEATLAVGTTFRTTMSNGMAFLRFRIDGMPVVMTTGKYVIDVSVILPGEIRTLGGCFF